MERIRAEEAAARGAREGPKELGDIHTDDEEDEEAEYELWRQRELRRIRRYALDSGMQESWVPSTCLSPRKHIGCAGGRAAL